MFYYLKTSVRERWSLFLIVMIALSCLGFGYMGSRSFSDRIVVQAQTDLDYNWLYHYDLLVLPRLPDEKKGLKDGWVAPQSAIASYGGISMEDLKSIRNLQGVQVAAPLSLIGYSTVNGIDVEYTEAKTGHYYEIQHVQSIFDGLKNYELLNMRDIKRFTLNGYTSDELSTRLAKEMEQPINTPVIGTQLKNPNELLIVAIDPEAEDAIFTFSDSLQMAKSLDEIEPDDRWELGGVQMLPVVKLLNDNTVMEETVVISSINVPENVTEQDYQNNAVEYLKSLPKKEKANINVNSFSNRWNRQHVALDLLGGSDYTEKKIEGFASTAIDVHRYSPIRFTSDGKENGEIPLIYAQQVEKEGEQASFSVPLFRKKISTIKRGFGIDVINYYNAEKVKPVRKGIWLEGEPLDIYTPHLSSVIEDGAGNQIESTPLLPLPLKSAYYTGAPDLLTTLDVAKHFYGSKPPISSIRVVVNGVEERSDVNQRKIEKIAEQIIELTGHHVEIMIGSSSSKVHVDLGTKGKGEARIVEEGWQQAGVSWSIEKQIEKTTTYLFFYVLIIIFIFCYTVITHSLLHRSVEFSILRSIGWSRQLIMKMLFFEIISIASFSLVPVILANSKLRILAWHELAVLLLIIILVITVGYITGIYKVLKVSPRTGLEGEGIQWKFIRLFSINNLQAYTFHQITRRPLRFGILAFVLALTAFMVLLFVATQKSLSDFLYLSFLGDSIDFNLKGYQKNYIFFGLLMTVSIVFILLFLNIQERKHEFFTLKSIGWSIKKIQIQLAVEAIIIAIFGTSFGVVGAYLFLFIFFRITVPPVLIIVVLTVSTLLLLLFSSLILALTKLNSDVKSHYP